MASGSKGSGFGSDDILCSYEEYVEEENSNGRHSDPAIGINSTKEFHKNRTAMFPSYSPPVEPSDEDVAVVVENTVKKYTDNLMRFLEGISSRLSQLELYCYNLDKTIGQMRSDIVRDNEEADIKLKSLEKHVQEVHRSVQILRDKQELADNQKELAKLQIAQKGSTSSTHSQHSEDRAAPQASDTKETETDDTPNVHSQQLALALPHQVAPQSSVPSRPLEQHQQAVVPLPPTVPQNVMQPQAYYPPSTPMPHSPALTPQSQVQYSPSDSQYQVPQPQDFSRMPPQSTQTQVNQPPQTHQLPQYQQQWPPQLPHQVQQSQARAPSTAPYPPYLPSPPTNPETLPGSVQMQMPMPGMYQPGASRSEAVPYGYGGAGAPGQPHPSLQQMKPGYGMQHGDGYTTGTRPTPLSQGNAYMMYESDGGRGQHSFQPPHFPHGGYPPSSVPLNQQHSGTVMARPPQFGRDHPYNDLIEKLVGMGYRGDHVITVIQRMDESGEAVDFNVVLDRLNVNSSGGAQRRG